MEVKKKVVTVRNRRQRNSNPPKISSQSAALGCYLRTLSDPWQYGPCRIGFGTMVPTQLGTAYFRGIVASNADGSIGVALIPSVGNGLYVANAGAAVATWSNSVFPNASSLQAISGEYRVVSAGLRLLPLVPGTAAPGIGYAASVPSLSISQITGTAPNGFIGNPQFHVGYAASGASAISLPVDPVSFQFLNSIQAGYGVNNSVASSTPMIILTGLPGATNVLIEAVLNLEGLMTYNSTGALNTPGQADDQPTLSDYFPSLDNMWSQAKRAIPSPVAIADGLNNMARIAVGAGRLVHTARQIRQQFFPVLQTANRLTIEEVP